MMVTIGLIGFAIGLALVGGIAFLAGRKGWWWLAVLISLPAALGGAMALTMDMSGMSFVFRNFGLFVLGQLAVTAIAYSVGRHRSQASAINLKDFQ